MMLPYMPMSDGSGGPTYDLDTVRRLVHGRRYRITGTARDDVLELGLDETDVVECILALSPGDFYKTMPAEKVPGLWQDVYRPVYCSRPLYVKVQMTTVGHDGERVVVISFKRK